jgi:FMNH2-dependent dimethyl sulfone monooxygenase
MSDGLGDRTAVSPAEFSDSPLSRVLRQPLILGLFLPVQSGGWSASLLPRTTDWRFDYNAALTKRAEQLGFDLVFGLAQWTSKDGYGGTSKYREDSLDSFIAVAALSPITDCILLISTVHVLFGPWPSERWVRVGEFEHAFRPLTLPSPPGGPGGGEGS